MISLGGIVLNPSLIWTDRFDTKTVDQSIRRTIGGRIVRYESRIAGGLPITLQAADDQGWLTYTQVVELLGMAEQSGSAHTLVYGDLTVAVAFRHSEPPAVSFKPFVQRQTHQATDVFTGTIKLLTV